MKLAQSPRSNRTVLRDGVRQGCGSRSRAARRCDPAQGGSPMIFPEHRRGPDFTAPRRWFQEAARPAANGARAHAVHAGDRALPETGASASAGWYRTRFGLDIPAPPHRRDRRRLGRIAARLPRGSVDRGGRGAAAPNPSLPVQTATFVSAADGVPVPAARIGPKRPLPAQRAHSVRSAWGRSPQRAAVLARVPAVEPDRHLDRSRRDGPQSVAGGGRRAAGGPSRLGRRDLPWPFLSFDERFRPQ